MITLRDRDSFVDIAKDELEEHDGIMEQITYEHSGDAGWPGSLKLCQMPWKYVETYCRFK